MLRFLLSLFIPLTAFLSLVCMTPDLNEDTLNLRLPSRLQVYKTQTLKTGPLGREAHDRKQRTAQPARWFSTFQHTTRVVLPPLFPEKIFLRPGGQTGGVIFFSRDNFPRYENLSITIQKRTKL